MQDLFLVDAGSATRGSLISAGQATTIAI